VAASVGDGIQNLIEIAQRSCHNFRRESTRGAYSLACFSASLASPRASLAAPLALSDALNVFPVHGFPPFEDENRRKTNRRRGGSNKKGHPYGAARVSTRAAPIARYPCSRPAGPKPKRNH
jgi:hypothetical protein